MKKENEKQNKIKRKYIYIIAFLGIILDQITKFIIRYGFRATCEQNICVAEPCPLNCLIDMLKEGGTFLGLDVIPGKGIEIIKNFFYLIEVKNTGGAWGIFSGNVPFLAVISAFVIILLYFFLKSEKSLNKISITYYGFLFAGIIGNFIDRIINGYVTDFLNFFIFNYDFPVFNIADIFIIVGVVLMIVDVVRGEIHVIKERKGKC